MQIFGKNIFGILDLGDYVYSGTIDIDSINRSGKLNIVITRNNTTISSSSVNDISYGTINTESE